MSRVRHTHEGKGAAQMEIEDLKITVTRLLLEVHTLKKRVEELHVTKKEQP